MKSQKLKIKNLKRSEMRSLKNYLGQGFFSFLYWPFKYMSFPFSNYFRFFIVKIFSRNIKSSYISEGVTFIFPWNIEIGKNSSLNSGVTIDGTAKVKIGNGVRIAPNVYFSTADHDFKSITPIVNQGFVVGEIEVNDHTWIGANSIINKAVQIGQGSVIGGGSVVTKSIPDYSIAFGVPCKVHSKRKV
jgi:acetyltransferase-like isoleucine patch superfamily enzyme